MNNELVLGWASHEAAKYACEKWHYSKCLPAGKLVRVGVWEGGKFIGVVLFSRGASPFLLKRYGMSQENGCELTRVALAKHSSPVSRIVKISLMLLKKACPGVRLVVSFADPEEGHHGGIYQAGNWIYTGTSSETIEYYVNGKWTHTRGAFYKKTSKTPARKRPGKHRYLMPLCSEISSRIASLAIKYPRRIK